MFFPVPPKREEPTPAAPPPEPEPPPAAGTPEAPFDLPADPPGPSALASPEIAQEVYTHALDALRAGVPIPEIESSLVRAGLTPAEAAETVATLARLRIEALKEQARKNMLFGALWRGGGALVTFASFAAAEGGGGFVLAWGAILYGAIQFFRGLTMSTE